MPVVSRSQVDRALEALPADVVRVFPRRTTFTPTDPLAFVGGVPLAGFLPSQIRRVDVSVTFSYDLKEGERLKQEWELVCPHVRCGGPAYADLGESFTPGMYLKHGFVITSRGCPNLCGFCVVPQREGRIRELPIKLGNPQKTIEVLDNNLMACRGAHIEAVFRAVSPYRVTFSGGIDARLLTSERIEQLRALRIDELFLAYDSPESWRETEKAIRGLRQAGMYRDQIRCYVLGGYLNTDTPARWEGRCEQVLEAGGLPFAMLYVGPSMSADDNYSDEWKAVRHIYTQPREMLRGQRRAQLERLGGYSR